MCDGDNQDGHHHHQQHRPAKDYGQVLVDSAALAIGGLAVVLGAFAINKMDMTVPASSAPPAMKQSASLQQAPSVSAKPGPAVR